MAQIKFEYNFAHIQAAQGMSVNNGTLTFVPMNIRDSISFLTMNIPVSVTQIGSSRTFTFNIGLYSMNGASLSIRNSMSATTVFSSSAANRFYYLSLTATSAAQNITPGTWFFGILGFSSSASQVSLIGQASIPVGNNFPGGFIGGAMTASTAALPANIATSDLDISGDNALCVPQIILSA